MKELSKNGTLSSSHTFKTEDAAATEVLDITAPLSKDYGLEMGGNLYQDDDKLWHYTMPEIGGSTSMSIGADWDGYHTHTSGKAIFSTFHYRAGEGNDAHWVSRNQQVLYLGVQSGNGPVSISACHPGNCSAMDRFGAIGRVVK